jgi:prepilin peptidase CpaA
MIELILSSFILLGLAIGTFTDIKTREVPDWVSYALIFIGLGLRSLYSIYYSDFSFILAGLLGLVLFLVIGMVMFYTGQWGGGDTKLLIGVGVLMGFGLDFSKTPQILSFFANLLIAGAFYGLLWSIFLAVKHRDKFVVAFRKNYEDSRIRLARRAIIVSSVLLLFLIFSPVSVILKILFVALAIIPISTFYVWLFARSVEQSCMFKKVFPNKLTEGDWVEGELKIGKKVFYSKKDLGVSKRQIELIKKHFKNKKILVKEGIPFIPSFLAAYIITLLFDAWFLMFL